MKHCTHPVIPGQPCSWCQPMKRHLHHIKVLTDEGGIVTDVLIDGKKVQGCTAITAEANAEVGFLNITISMEAGSFDGPGLFIKKDT